MTLHTIALVDVIYRKATETQRFTSVDLYPLPEGTSPKGLSAAFKIALADKFIKKLPKPVVIRDARGIRRPIPVWRSLVYTPQQPC